MLFSGPVKKQKKDCVSLQVHKPKQYYIKNESSLLYCPLYIFRKRVCLFTFLKNRRNEGSVSIEVLISMFTFMMIVLFLGSYMVIINTEMSMQQNLENTVRNASKNMFYLKSADEISEYDKNLSDIKNQLKDKFNQDDYDIEEVVKDGYLITRLIGDIGISNLTNEKYICDIRGLNVTKNEMANGEIYFAINYKIKQPLVNRYITMTQGCYVKDWTGSDITESGKKVYITKNGEVYHRTKECSHLIINISKITVEQAIEGFNGRKYSRCSNCTSKGMNVGDYVFVTGDGDRYHADLKCNSITRRVIEIDISQVGDKRPCSGCY